MAVPDGPGFEVWPTRVAREGCSGSERCCVVGQCRTPPTCRRAGGLAYVVVPGAPQVGGLPASYRRQTLLWEARTRCRRIRGAQGLGGAEGGFLPSDDEAEGLGKPLGKEEHVSCGLLRGASDKAVA